MRDILVKKRSTYINEAYKLNNATLPDTPYCLKHASFGVGCLVTVKIQNFTSQKCNELM
jgi:hypothetical protein